MSTKFTIRDWQEADMQNLARIHDEMHIGFPLPTSFGPLFPIKKAVMDQNGNVIGMATVKIIGEAMIWLDPQISTLKRAKSVMILNKECRKEAQMLGLDEVSCWMPTKIARCFRHLLQRLGWKRSPWRNWTILLDEEPQ